MGKGNLTREQAITRRIAKAMKKAITIDVLDGLEKSYGRKATKKEFRTWRDEAVSRVKRGWGKYDSWNLNWWMMRTFSEMLAFLSENCVGYADNTLKLHSRCRKIDFKDYPDAPPQAPDESLEDYKYRLYKFDVARIGELFREANEETSSVQNDGEPVGRYSFKEDGDGYFILEDNLTDEEKAQNDRWFKKEREVCRYRSKCLHKAIRMLDVYIEDLFD